MRRIILSTLAATFLCLGAAVTASADGAGPVPLPPPTITPATTCMNCK